MTDAFIFDHVRTPRGRGRPDGALHEVPPISLATQALVALQGRTQLQTQWLDDVVLGCVSPIGDQGSAIGRVAALNAGYADSVGGYQLNRFCASGLEAVNSGAAQVMSGQSDAVVAGGVESMSRVPIGSDGGAWYGDPTVARQTYFVPQGIGADLIATLQGYSREDVDRYALESQRRAAQSAAEQRSSRSMIPVHDVMGEVLLDRDEYPRPSTTLADLAALKPAFREAAEDGGFASVALHRYPGVESIRYVHTAGNSSGIVDGAAMVLIGNRGFGRRAGLKPRARIRAFASIGSEPAIMLTGPALATRKALKRAGMSLSDIDLFEVNEAFAAVVMRFMDDTGVPHDKINVNGGAIALGHPLGATGAMILGTLIDELERRKLRFGLATLCIGGGMGIATIVERL